MIYKCLRCNKVLTNRYYLFKECVCGHKNITINKVPIVVEDYASYCANKILNYKNYINTLEAQKTTIISSDVNQSIEIDNKIALLKELQKDLLPYTSVENFLNIDLNPNLGYDLSYEYLIRDWSNTEQTEQEIRIILNSIFEKIEEYNENALVLGAGLGRLALEFRKVYKRVTAIDLSYEMPALLERISNKTMEFEYNLIKNSSDYNNSPLQVKIDNTFVNNIINDKTDSTFEYFVSDVTKLPFFDFSFETIISCYFTDVLPIRSYFHELDRVLKIGGSFVHFGPLDYHFDDVNNMLSLKELKSFFELRGYIVELYSPIELEHIKIEIKGKKNIYTNWFFKATKTHNINNLSFNSTLKVYNNINITLKGELTNDNDEFDINEVTLSSVACKSFNCTIDSVHILEKINGVRTISEIFEELEKEDHIIDDEVKLNTLNMLSDLVKFGYLINVL